VTEPERPDPSRFATHFVIDPRVVYLNHGSFGACPAAVLEAQAAHQRRAERELVKFYVDDAWALLDRSRAALAPIVGVDPADLVFVRNATTGVATVLANLDLDPNDEVLTTTLEYAACENNLRDHADRAGASIVLADPGWPIQDEDRVVDAVLGRVTDRTRLCMLSLVTSATGVRMPIERLIPPLRDKGVRVLLDAAHGPGCVPMDLAAWGADYATGNAHKWLCAPKGAAFLHVRPELQTGFRPLVLSNDARRLDAASAASGRSAFNHAFDYAGTDDISPALTIADAIDWLDSAVPGGLGAIMEHNRVQAIEGRRLVLDALSQRPEVPESMLGPMAAITLDRPAADAPQLKRRLMDEHAIEVPVWGAPKGRAGIRLSAQLYNSPEQYAYLASSLAAMLRR